MADEPRLHDYPHALAAAAYVFLLFVRMLLRYSERWLFAASMMLVGASAAHLSISWDLKRSQNALLGAPWGLSGATPVLHKKEEDKVNSFLGPSWGH